MTKPSNTDWAVSKSLCGRFWSKVNKNGPLCERLGSNCWVWTASVAGGYGILGVGVDYRNRSAHRVSWVIHYGRVPDGLLVLHQCDNKICVRPDHLYLGGYSENGLDAFSRGQSVPIRGEDVKISKLTEEIVRYCRKVYIRGHHEFGCKPLAYKFGVDQGTMRVMLQGKTWRHVK